MSLVTLVYGFDPLCGWCYGFRPVFEKLRAATAGKARWVLSCGGLVTGERERPIGETRAYLLQGMQAVEARTGVRFGPKFRDGILAQGTWVSRSEPACRAVLEAQSLDAEKGLDFASALSEAFYLEGLAPDSDEGLKFAATRSGIDEAALKRVWDTPEARERTSRAFAEARRQGVTMYPSVFLSQGNKLVSVFEGCPSYDDAWAAIEARLKL